MLACLLLALGAQGAPLRVPLTKRLLSASSPRSARPSLAGMFSAANEEAPVALTNFLDAQVGGLPRSISRMLGCCMRAAGGG